MSQTHTVPYYLLVPSSAVNLSFLYTVCRPLLYRKITNIYMSYGTYCTHYTHYVTTRDTFYVYLFLFLPEPVLNPTHVLCIYYCIYRIRKRSYKFMMSYVQTVRHRGKGQTGTVVAFILLLLLYYIH